MPKTIDLVTRTREGVLKVWRVDADRFRAAAHGADCACRSQAACMTHQLDESGAFCVAHNGAGVWFLRERERDAFLLGPAPDVVHTQLPVFILF